MDCSLQCPVPAAHPSSRPGRRAPSQGPGTIGQVRAYSPTTAPWRIVVPVKRLHLAKTRLALPPGLRAELVLAMALDTVSAAARCGRVGGVTVVTSDDRVRAAFTALGTSVVDDTPDEGLNQALAHGIATGDGDGPTATLSADLPALQPGELQRALDAATGAPRTVVADAAGTGTTLLTALSAQWLRPEYGPDSLRRHERAGHVVLVLDDIAGLQRDVDTIEDLYAAGHLGVGKSTAEALAGAGIPVLQSLPLR